MKVVVGAACAAGLMAHPRAALAESLDTVLRRLEALEQSNAKLQQENAGLRERVKRIEGVRAAVPAGAPMAAAPGAGGAKGNPVGHVGVAPSPGPPPPPPGYPVKAGVLGPVIDNTAVTIYGHVDVSGDIFNPSVFDQGTKFAIASNTSYFGIRARHNLAPYGYPGFAVVAQFEEQVDVASQPTERAAFGTRDSYVGFEGPWGAIKAGKSDTPYKKSTGAFDPFANTLGDYNSIMGNTGGDNRAEFDWRMPHAIWYESPIISGFQFSALFSPGQNYAQDNSDFAYGDLGQCNGTSARGSGSNFPGTNGAVVGNIGGNGCTDGTFGNAFSSALTYKNGPFTAIAAYELHQDVNRHADDGLEGGPNNPIVPVFLADGSQVITGVHNEWAAKVGAGYRIAGPIGPLQLYGIYEWMRRDDAPAAFNERSRDGFFLSATQYVGPHWSFSASWAHAGPTPGNPAMLSVNDPVLAPQATLQGNQFDDSANMYALGTRYRFNDWASWYLVGSWLTQGPGAHYCLGASGHGYQVCSRDQFNDTIGGATIKAATTGITLDF